MTSGINTNVYANFVCVILTALITAVYFKFFHKNRKTINIFENFQIVCLNIFMKLVLHILPTNSEFYGILQTVVNKYSPIVKLWMHGASPLAITHSNDKDLSDHNWPTIQKRTESFQPSVFKFHTNCLESAKNNCECYVTFVADDEGAIDALVLIKSIRLTQTNRKILALVGPNVSASSRNGLNETMDGCLCINPTEEDPWTQKDLLTYAKIYCWSLPFFKKCIFVDSSLLFLENCDDLFNNEETLIAQFGNEKFDTSLIMFEGSQHFYLKLMNLMQQKLSQNGTGTSAIAKAFSSCLVELFQPTSLDPTYSLVLDLNNGSNNSLSVGKPKIAKVEKCKLPSNPSNGGRNDTEKKILDFWKALAVEMNSIMKGQDLSKFKPLKQNFRQEPIAIVGTSFRLPGANNEAEIWDLMMNHCDGMQKIPDARWTKAHSCVTDADQRTYHVGFLKCPVDEFDAPFFGMSPIEATYTDPQQRLLLEVGYEALEHANMDPSSLKGTPTGVFTGVWMNDYKELMIESGFRKTEFFRSYMGNTFGTTSSRLSHCFGLTGPCISTESGCSSSLVALGLACESLRKRTSNIALACGVNLILRPYKYEDMKVICSADGHCKTFDESADGMGRSEGVGVLVLKRLSDAIKDNDKVYALIRGYGQAQEGSSNSLGTPTVHCESLAMGRALEDAGVAGKDVTFMECHGPGTPVGDPLEIKSITKVYSPDRTQPLILGSIKTNIGHTESCSGIASIVKTILAFEKEVIPPHRWLKKLNPQINLEAIPAIIPMDPVPWKKVDNVPRLASVSNFGLTGTDAHAILEEPPTSTNDANNKLFTESLPSYILPISTKSEEALDELLEKYKELLETDESPNMLSVAYTAAVGRSHLNYRATAEGKTREDILRSISDGNIKRKSVALNTKPKICFLFTGQGSQYVNMGKTLYNTSPVFKMNFDKCNQVLETNHGISIPSVFWGDQSHLSNETLYSQTALFVIAYCLAKLWESIGITPDCVLGHSVGEFAAACIAGILSFEDAIKLIATRTVLTQPLPAGKMIVMEGDHTKAVELINAFTSNNKGSWLDVAAINSQFQTTLSGSPESVTAFKEFAKIRNVKTHILSASHAFHSRDMDPILPEYLKTAIKVKLNPAKCTYISSVTGKEETKFNANYWIKHTRNHVEFVQAAKYSIAAECNVYIEVGPNPILSALVASNAGNEAAQFVPSMRRNADEWSTLMDAVGQLYLLGCDIKWNGLYQFYNIRKTNLPFYPFQRKKYWFNAGQSQRGNTFNLENQIHPLLGCQLENATENKIFQSSIDLERFSYIRDHKLGEKVIFPGSGFIETSLVAGHAALFPSTADICPPKPGISIKNLVIKAPLQLFEEEQCDIQTVVRTDGGLSHVSIYSQGSSFGGNSYANKWNHHTDTDFACEKTDLQHFKTFNLDELKKKFSTLIQQTFYDDLLKFGYNFGPTFRSIQKIWTIESGKEFLVEVSVPEETHGDYFCHPIAIDAMLQSCLISNDVKIDTLHLPFTVENFSWFKASKESILYAHVYMDQKESQKCVTLYNPDGDCLAWMYGLQFFKTTLSKFTSSLKNSDMELPNLFQEKWISSAVQPKVDVNEPFLEKYQTEMTASVSSPPLPEDLKSAENMDKAIGLGIMLAFINLGWSPTQIGKLVNVLELLSELKISNVSLPVFRRLLEILAEENILIQSPANRDNFTVKQLFPPVEYLTKTIDELSQSGFKTTWPFVLFYLNNLPRLLLNNPDALRALFPKTINNHAAEYFYNKCESSILNNGLLKNCLEFLINKRYENTKQTGPLRILEIGAGTGSASKLALPVIHASGCHYLYDYTDISHAFFVEAKNNFKTYAKNMQFRVVDVEKDPRLQGFAPNQYDIIIAANVLHATCDLNETCSNVRTLLNSHGVMLLLETFIPQRQYDISVGHLDGFWRYTDFELRQKSCLLSTDKWTSVLKDVGFEHVVPYSVLGGRFGVVVAEASENQPQYIIPRSHVNGSSTWIVFANDSPACKSIINQLSNNGRTVLKVIPGDGFKFSRDLEIQVRPNKKEDFEAIFQMHSTKDTADDIEGVLFLWGLQDSLSAKALSEAYLYLLKNINQSKFPIIQVSEGQMYIEDEEPTSPASSTLLGMSRTYRTENPTTVLKNIDLDPNEADSDSKAKTLIYELWIDNKELFVAYRSGTRYVARLEVMEPDLKYIPLQLPASSRFALELPQSKSIDDLKFAVCSESVLEDNFIELGVRAAGLNFRDIFNVLKPNKTFENVGFIGTDFAGIVTRIGSKVTKFKIGDPVMGCNRKSEALPSHICISETECNLIPDYMTFPEAATLPTVFGTAYYFLITIGKLKEGETVLIHTASGGVGLIAIQVAQQIGATVITTAGSRRKRAYLRNLRIKHTFNSRSTEFEKQIKALTGGKGVNLILNSLTGPGFKEASLACVCKEGTFIEMSKMNVWAPEEVKLMRPDVKYSIEDLSTRDGVLWSHLCSMLKKYMDFGQAKPLPVTEFDSVNCRDALKHLQRAKHIGKIVCKMPINYAEKNFVDQFSEMFNDRSTYFITGGFQGIGLALAQWMTKNGAKYIILTGRRQPDANCLKVTEELNQAGFSVHMRILDVQNLEDCEALFNPAVLKEMNCPAIRGVMHCAGSLADDLIVNQTWERFQKVYTSKVMGTWNMHQVTKSLNLEHFVLFSSISSLLGLPGQSNHAAVNAYMNTFAQYRRALGLPAISILYGQWGETGIVANKTIKGFTSFSTTSGINTLKFVMKHHLTNVAACDGDYTNWSSLFPWSDVYMQTLRQKNSNQIKKETAMSTTDFWAQVDGAKDNEQRNDFIHNCVLNILCHILQLDAENKINISQGFDELGIDSLMRIQMQNLIQNLLGSRSSVDSKELRDCNNIASVTELITASMSGEGPKDDADPVVVRNLLIKEDRVLWPSIKIQKDAKICKEFEISTVLLTGATGTLAPYILQILTKNPQIKRVYCLIRHKKSSTIQERVENRLKDIGIYDSVDMSKVVVIQGSISAPFLGMDEEMYNILSSEVDAIINSAVHSDHLQEYKKSSSNYGVRATNTLGTHRLIEFAVNTKPKWFYHASSLVASLKVAEDGTMCEDWPKTDEFDDGPNFGYATSKYVADLLLAEACKLGLKCKTFRFPLIVGNSKNGKQDTKENHFFMRYMSYFQSGFMPNMDFPLNVLPVDVCADISLRIFFNSKAQPGMYHVFHPTSLAELDLINVGKEIGCKIEAVNYDTFINQLEKQQENSLLHSTLEFYRDSERWLKLVAKMEYINYWKQSSKQTDYFESKKIAQLIPNFKNIVASPMEILKQNVLYGKKDLKIEFNKYL